MATLILTMMAGHNKRMLIYKTNILHRPSTSELRYLPEGPYSCNQGCISWVAIQNGTDAKVGSLNVLNLERDENESFAMDGRPGFAYPTDVAGVFVVGLERQVKLYNTATGECRGISGPVESGVEGTIINDGLVFDEGLIFGCKDLEFKTPKAGLYFWRSSDRQLFQLRDDQLCSNGKVITRDQGRWGFLDIDSPTKRVVAYELDVDAGVISDPQVILDFTSRVDIPDGMIGVPGGQSVIVAFYNPADAAFGEAVQFRLADGEVEAVWRTDHSPRVTCPQLVRYGGGVKLVLTTAVEGMSPDQLGRHTNAGCLFWGDTDFDTVGEQPVFKLRG